jgi:hypothetical protein
MHRTMVTGSMAALLVLGGVTSSAQAAQPGPVFVKGAVGAKVSAGKLTIPRPSGTSAGDVLIAGVAEHEVGSATAPAGWKLIRQDRDKANRDVWLWVYYRVAGASEPSSYVWKVGDDAANGAILAYRGVDGADPVVASAGKADVSGTTTAILGPSMNVGPVRNTMLVMFAMVEGPSPNPITPPPGFTERTERGAHPTTESSDMAFAGTGATGARAARAKVGGGPIGQVGSIVALRPAP